MRCLLRGGIFFYFYRYIIYNSARIKQYIIYLGPLSSDAGRVPVRYIICEIFAHKSGLIYCALVSRNSETHICEIFARKNELIHWTVISRNRHRKESFGIARICKKFAHPWLDLHLNLAQTCAPNGYSAVTERPGVGKKAKILNILLKSSWKC